MSGVIYRLGGWEPNPQGGMYLDTHIHAHTNARAYAYTHTDVHTHRHTHTDGLSCRRCWNACKSWNASWDAELPFHTPCSQRQESWQMEALKHINHLPLWADKHLIWLMTPEDQNKCREIKTGRGRRRGMLKKSSLTSRRTLQSSRGPSASLALWVMCIWTYVD